MALHGTLLVPFKIGTAGNVFSIFADIWFSKGTQIENKKSAEPIRVLIAKLVPK